VHLNPHSQRDPIKTKNKINNKTTMKSTQSIDPLRSRGFTLIELLVVIAIIAILAGFALPVFSRAQKKGRLTDSVSNAKQTTLALRMYADDNGGLFVKTQTDGVTALTAADKSNTAFNSLLPTYTADKRIFFNKASVWCQTPTADVPGDNVIVKAKQCDWLYICGLTSTTSDPRWPLIATAPVAAAITYSKTTSVAGGVWAGTDAVIGFVDGAARILTGPDMNTAGATTYPKNPSDPTKNMLDGLSTADWFAPAASGVLTLYPL